MATTSSNVILRRRIQQRDIAERAGVSISTVSRVLNNVAGISGPLQQRVLAAAAELGYQNTEVQQTNVERIGLFTMLPLAPLLDPFHADILNGVEAECRRHGIQLTYASTGRDPASSSFVLDRIDQHQVDGVILLSVDDSLLIEQILTTGVLPIVINAEHPALPVDTFLPDNYFGALQATRYLIAHGHRRILHLTHLERRTIQRRHVGYQAALQEAGIAYDLGLVCDTQMDAEQTYTFMRRMLAKHPPTFTAIFCANDTTAIGALRALQEMGYHVPNDVSIIGYDDIPVAAFLTPPLTTMRIEREELGALAVRRLIDRAAMSLTPIRVELTSRLIERRSVARVSPIAKE